jgi:hypothetical protein
MTGSNTDLSRYEVQQRILLPQKRKNSYTGLIAKLNFLVERCPIIQRSLVF